MEILGRIRRLRLRDKLSLHQIAKRTGLSRNTIRKWLRAIQLKHWKRGSTMYRELRSLGASQSVAKQVAGNSRRWWRNSDRLLKTTLTIAYFDRLGVPRLS